MATKEYRMMSHRVRRHHLILLMLADGATIAEIADEVHVAECTVKHDISDMKRLFQARNVCNLIALAYQKGILRPYANSKQS